MSEKTEGWIVNAAEAIARHVSRTRSPAFQMTAEFKIEEAHSSGCAAVTAEKERADAAEAKLAKHKRLKDDPWHWMGDGSDHLETLICPILIEADDLRAIVDQAAIRKEPS